jgi:hypothetical protein
MAEKKKREKSRNARTEVLHHQRKNPQREFKHSSDVAPFFREREFKRSSDVAPFFRERVPREMPTRALFFENKSQEKSQRETTRSQIKSTTTGVSF